MKIIKIDYYPNEKNFAIIDAYLMGKFGYDNDVAESFRSKDNTCIFRRA